jgi:hypothetical protein
MKKPAFPAFFVFLFVLAATPALADCYQVADQVAAQYGAEVISVREGKGTCIIKLRMPGQGGQPPRVETIEVPG